MQKIKDYIIQNEKQWKIVLEKFCSKNCELLKHGQWHRVYKDKNYDFMVYEKNESLPLDEGYGIQLSTNSIKILMIIFLLLTL